MKYLLSMVFIMLLVGCNDSTAPAPAPAPTPTPTPTPTPMFQDVSIQAGIVGVGPSFGAGSWGDVNGDGKPDLWVGNHANQPNLYLNNANGTFADVTTQYWSGVATADTHGAVWTDVDKDGRLDLLELVGAQSGAGVGANHLYFNRAGSFIDQAQLKGIDYPLGRGRTPLPIDLNHNGLTDFILSGFYRAGGGTELFIQDPYTSLFSPQAALQGLTLPAVTHKSAYLADLNNDDKLDVVVNSYQFPHRIFDVSTLPAIVITKSLAIPVNSETQDVVFGDFNNDLYTDIYVARAGVTKQSQVAQLSPSAIVFRMTGKTGTNKNFSFTSSLDTTFELGILPLTSIHIGASGQNPLATTFTLNPQDPYAQGLAPQTAPGVYIGFNTMNQMWEYIAIATTTRGKITSTSNVTLGNVSNLQNAPVTPGRLFMNQGNTFLESAVPSAIGKSVVTGDFDNDMDLDLYIVESGTAKNSPNVLLLNDGNGVFTNASAISGAEGSDLGIGDSVTTVDYDGDGYLDLFVTNGEGLKPLTLNGPQQLFHNNGGSNHWLEIDLKGMTSQIEGVGAVVYVTAGGITQKREQNAGIHKNSQNHARLHFGLAANTLISNIKVVWPNGNVQVLHNILGDQVLTIVEQ